MKNKRMQRQQPLPPKIENPMRRHAMDGITLIEAMLVMMIAAFLVVMGLKQYDLFKRDASLVQLQSNIDELFSGAAGYYQANCNQGGQLDPAIVGGTVKGLDITTDLIDAGFLSATAIKPNPLVDSTGPGNGYAVQFNEYLVPRYQETCSNPPTCSTTTTIQIGTNVIWRIQVSVLMRNTDPGKLENAKSMLGGSCLADATGIPPTTPLCSTNPTGNSVVLDRSPSMVISDPAAQSPLWVSAPRYRQINQPYQTNPMTDLTSRSHTPEYQYFYCNG